MVRHLISCYLRFYIIGIYLSFHFLELSVFLSFESFDFAVAMAVEVCCSLSLYSDSSLLLLSGRFIYFDR